MCSDSNVSKLTGWHFITEQDKHPEHTTKANKELFWAKMWNILNRPSQLLGLNPVELPSTSTRLNAEKPHNKHELSCSQESITREDTKILFDFIYTQLLLGVLCGQRALENNSLKLSWDLALEFYPLLCFDCFYYYYYLLCVVVDQVRFGGWDGSTSDGVGSG